MKKNAKNAKNLCPRIKKGTKTVIFHNVRESANSIMIYLKYFFKTRLKISL